MATKAYGSITITDLLDTATYIYYSQTNSTSISSWHKDVQSTDKFIGIYSGPPISGGQPINPTQSILNEMDINKYVGDDGSQILKITTAPTAYTTVVGSFTPAYRISLSTVKTQSGASEVRVGDILEYSYYHYGVGYVDSSYVYTTARTSIRGEAGYNTATIYLYSKTKTTIDWTNSLTYTFATNTLNSIPSGWSISSSITGSGKLYMTSAVAYSNTTTDTIAYNEWSTPVQIEGNDGKDGNLYTFVINPNVIYKFFSQNEGMSYSSDYIEFYLSKINESTSSTDRLNPNSQYDYKIRVYDSSSSLEIDNLYTLLNALYGKLKDTDSYTKLSSIFFEITNTSVKLNTKIIPAYNLDTSRGTAAQQALFTTFQNSITGGQPIFIISVFEKDTDYLIDTQIVTIDFGTSHDMAQFALESSKIQAAIGASKMTFSSDGLTIQNGGLTITSTIGTGDGKTETVELLSYSAGDNALKIVGNGEFTGKIIAESGEFSGELKAATGTFSGELIAPSGKIGGFIIEEDRLTAGNNLVLNSDGTISGGKIKLSEAAEIDRYIQLGNAKIWNPNDTAAIVPDIGKLFIETNGVKLYENGLLTIGNLKLDGINGKISGSNWSIENDFANFGNINVSGKIVTAVFESQKIQTVGGAMLFKPTYKINSISNNIITVDSVVDTDETKVNDYLILIDKQGHRIDKVYKITAINDNTITVNSSIDSIDLNSVIVLGPKLSNNDTINIGRESSVILGINSNSNPTYLLQPEGLTMGTFDVDDATNKLSTTVKLFLGNLDRTSLGTGYGLYAENVYLDGSLTTKSVNTKYAGVNTYNGVTATQFNDDNSPIIFWAGSEGKSDEEIQEAKFQVTEEGSIYASQGIFKGSIISDTVISNSEIYAANIYGATLRGRIGGPDGNIAPLKIYSTDPIKGGIQFLHEDENNHQEYVDFQIRNDGFSIPKLNVQPLIINNSDNIIFNGDEFNTPLLKMCNNYITNINSNNRNKIDNNINLQIGNTITTFSNTNVTMPQTLTCDSLKLSATMEYRKILSANETIGYDLYVI